MSHNILIVEDDPAINHMYQFKLEREGFTVMTAFTGEEGFLTAKAMKPDLILLDLMMPRMTGDEMLERLRATRWGSSIRVVILTNLNKNEAPMKLRFLNVSRYIVKAHYTPRQVVETVKDVLGIKAKKI